MQIIIVLPSLPHLTPSCPYLSREFLANLPFEINHLAEINVNLVHLMNTLSSQLIAVVERLLLYGTLFYL